MAQLNVPLDGSMVDEEEAGRERAGTSSRSHRAKPRSPADEAGDFLDRHPMVKIVVIIDTHCLEETGAFIYQGSSPESYKGCGMDEVSSIQLRTIYPHFHTVHRSSMAASLSESGGIYPMPREPLATHTKALS